MACSFRGIEWKYADMAEPCELSMLSWRVQLHIKNEDRNQFLFETSVEVPVAELISQLARLYNGRQKVDGFVKVTSVFGPHYLEYMWPKPIITVWILTFDSYIIYLRVNAVYRLLSMLYAYYGNVKSSILKEKIQGSN